MEAVGEKCSFRGKIWLCKWDTSKVVLTEQEMSWRQWDLVRQAIRSWETSCMVKRAVRSFTATSLFLVKRLGYLLLGSKNLWFEDCSCNSRGCMRVTTCALLYATCWNSSSLFPKGNISWNIYYVDVSRDCSKKLEEALHTGLLLFVEQIYGEGENLDLSLKLIPKGKILEAGHRAQMSWKNGGGKGGGWKRWEELSGARLTYFYHLWKSLEGAEGRHPAGAGLDEAQCSAMGMRNCQREVHPCLNSILLPLFEPEMQFKGCHVDIFHYYC